MNKGECSKCGKTVITSRFIDGVCHACRQPEQSTRETHSRLSVPDLEISQESL